MKSRLKKLVIILLIAALAVPVSLFARGEAAANGSNSENSNKPGQDPTGTVPTFENASVHDPSVIQVEDEENQFYVFGSHLAAAKSDDLMNWKKIADGANPVNPLFEDVTESLKETFDWAESDTLWAADVIQLEDGRYYMYYNACRGDSPRSAMGIAVSDSVDGPYEDLGLILKSGMRDSETGVDGTPYDEEIYPEVYDATVHPNVVDPSLFYDEDGKLWMMYGSYSGGIFILEMDNETGKPIPGQGYGKKMLGGNHSRIEAPYVVYSPETDYYYMYLSFGGLDAVGGYNMRVVRSENPDGPYLDAAGNDMINAHGREETIFDDESIEPYGTKIMGNFQFERKIGDSGSGIGNGYVSPGHNSVYYDEETGEQFLIFHARFPERGESHEIRVHQLFMNENGWPVAAPHRYGGEELGKVNSQDLAGDYQFINHGQDITAEIKKDETITLNKNNKISGAVSGKWKKTGHNKAELIIDGKTYDGVFVEQYDPAFERFTMTFTALSEDNTAVWGSKIDTGRTDEQVVADVKEDLNLGDTSGVVADLALPTEGSRDTAINWSSSNPEVVSADGQVTRPEAGSESAEVILTATIVKSGITDTKDFTVIVLPKKEKQLTAHYGFEENLADHTGNYGEGTPTGDRITNTGGTISYQDGKIGDAAVFNGESGVRLPNGLIMGTSYSVSLWLNPEQLTLHTTAFFGARDGINWVSVVPGGIAANNNTMVWSGGPSFYDGHTGVRIPMNQWSHLAFTVDEGEITIYINGEEKMSESGFNNVFTTSNSEFGLAVNYWDTPYQGLMDELKIYQGALTAEEVAALANPAAE